MSGAERVIDIDVRHRGELRRKGRIVLLFARVEAQILEQVDAVGRAGRIRRVDKRHRDAQATPTGASATGFRENCGFGFPFGRPRCDARITDFAP